MTAASRRNLSFATNLPGVVGSQIMPTKRQAGCRFPATQSRCIFNGSCVSACHRMIASIVNCPVCRKSSPTKHCWQILLFHVDYEPPGPVFGWTECRFHIYMWMRCRPLSELLRVERDGSCCQRQH